MSSILAKKLERKTSAFYLILSPALLLQKSIGGETEKKTQQCLLIPSQKNKNIFRTWRAEDVMSIKRKQQNKNCPLAPSPSLELKHRPLLQGTACLLQRELPVQQRPGKSAHVLD